MNPEGGAMTAPLALRGKWTFQARDQRLVFAKKADESEAHVLMKAFLWALFLPEYPNLQVEVAAGGRYKPDLVAFDSAGEPIFWAEAGYVGERKLGRLVRRRSLHFVMAKWNTRLDPFVRMAEKALRGVARQAPVELIAFPGDAADRFIQGREIRIDESALDRIRF
jgi:hypothetical protein